MSISIGAKIDEEYSRIRDKNDEVRRRRLSEVYSKIPRVAEIDAEIAELRAGMIQSIFSKSGNDGGIEKRITHLLDERELRLKAGGFDADYTSAVYTCKKCSDTGYILTKPCECYKQKKMKFLMEYANLSEAMKEQTFEKFDFSLYDKGSADGISPFDYAVSAFTQCRNFVKNKEYKNGKNMILYGSTGLGKTYLCSCIASALAEDGVQVMYQTAYTLTSQMEEQKFRGVDNSDITDLYYTVPVLIIDDLGTEFSSSFTSTVIFDLLNTRLGNGKSTIISTNLSIDESKEHSGARVQSRILGEYELLKLYGRDIRTKKLLEQ